MMRPHLQVLADKSQRAASEMVTKLAAAIFAGNENMTADGACKLALDAAEYILSKTVPTADENDEDDGNMASEDDS